MRWQVYEVRDDRYRAIALRGVEQLLDVAVDLQKPASGSDGADLAAVASTVHEALVSFFARSCLRHVRAAAVATEKPHQPPVLMSCASILARMLRGPNAAALAAVMLEGDGVADMVAAVLEEVPRLAFYPMQVNGDVT